MEIDGIYTRYLLRLHRLLLFKALVIYVLYNIAMVISTNVIGFEEVKRAMLIIITLQHDSC